MSTINSFCYKLFRCLCYKTDNFENKNIFLKINKNVNLCYIDIHDSKSLFNLIEKNRYHLRKWLPWLDNTKSVNDSVDFVTRAIDGYKNKDSLVLSIKYENKIVGIISFNNIDLSLKTASIGYWIDFNYQGKGIISTSCRALVDYGFKVLGLYKIMISCAVENYKSQLIPQRLNFKKQEIIKNKEWLYDHYVDHIVFSIKKEDFV